MCSCVSQVTSGPDDRCPSQTSALTCIPLMLSCLSQTKIPSPSNPPTHTSHRKTRWLDAGNTKHCFVMLFLSQSPTYCWLSQNCMRFLAAFVYSEVLTQQRFKNMSASDKPKPDSQVAPQEVKASSSHDFSSEFPSKQERD